MISKVTTFKVRSTCKVACFCYHCHNNTAPSYVTDMLQKIHLLHATLAPNHTPCLFSIDLHTVRLHLVIARFLLLLLLYGTLFKMTSGVPNHCHHLSLVLRDATFSLQGLNFLSDHCIYVYGLAVSMIFFSS